MRKAENSLSGLVHPSDDFSQEILDIKRCLLDIGFSKADSEWLVEIFKDPDCYGDPSGASAFNKEFSLYFERLLPCTVEKLSEPVQVGKVRQTRLAFLLHSLLGFGSLGEARLPNAGIQKSDDPTGIPGWIGEFQKHAKFSDQHLDWFQLKELKHFDDLLPFLLPKGVVLNYDSKDLEFWFIWRFGDNEKRRDKVQLDTSPQDFSDDVLSDKILGLLNAIDNAMRSLPPFNNGWRVVAYELIPLLELLNARKPELNQERSPLLKAWWHLSKLIYGWSNGGLESELSDELRNRLVESASRHIGILRSVLRNAPEVFEDEEVRDFYDKAFYVLLSFAPPWKRLKPLLLAFTEMTEQAVARDLRTWREHDSTDNPPPIYSRVPNWIEVAMYPQNLKDELERDPHLQELREEFAKFCLGRLRTKGKNKESSYTNRDFVEPRPVWRGCYVQALKALRVNPGGRAHRTLFWLLNNDPDEEVREYARRAHRQVRHIDRNKPNLDKGSSPRRPLFEAFWWLRQAHLITLGIEVDQAGAMRTRRTELHRTREKDDRYKWKR